jgi:hypothetical protein
VIRNAYLRARLWWLVRCYRYELRKHFTSTPRDEARLNALADACGRIAMARREES